MRLSKTREFHQRHILVAEDNPLLCAELTSSLADEGFLVSTVHDVAGIFRVIEQGPVDLLTLDLGMAGADEFNLVPKIRAARNLPIVMITGRDSPADRLAGLEHGVDDYITKPFLMREAVLRVRASLARHGLAKGEGEQRRVRRPAANLVKFDGRVLDLRAHTVTRPGARTEHLTETEFRLLEILLAQPQQVFSRDDLCSAALGREWSPTDRTVDGHVARLRRKLGDNSPQSPVIRSVRGVGYVFVGELAAASASLAPDRH
jgi:DNA-binding response OmpR family regulator